MLGWVFHEVLGLDAVYADHAGERIEIHFQRKVLLLETDFFRLNQPTWLRPGGLVVNAAADWHDVAATLNAGLPDDAVPVLWGRPGFSRDAAGNGHLYMDIVGAIFFMLSRYEEVVKPERDQYGRFPAEASLALQRDFLRRPLVDEYIELLWSALRSVWPGLVRKTVAGTMRVTCDVDEPYERWIRNPWLLAQGVGGALLRHRSLGAAAGRVRNAWLSRRGRYECDPHWTFDWYMDTLEEHGCVGAFYFIPTYGHTRYDCMYRLTEARMQGLLKTIATRGHEIGMHGSFQSFRDRALLARERQHLLAACHRAGVAAPVLGNRQHYLRWDAGQTPDHLAHAGFGYDSSGGFPYHPGFRHGTARSFPMWSWIVQRPLALRQRPLIMMESAVIDVLGLGRGAEALASMRALKRAALRYGDFTLLWHNSRFTAPDDTALFAQLLAA